MVNFQLFPLHGTVASKNKSMHQCPKLDEYYNGWQINPYKDFFSSILPSCSCGPSINHAMFTGVTHTQTGDKCTGNGPKRRAEKNIPCRLVVSSQAGLVHESRVTYDIRVQHLPVCPLQAGSSQFAPLNYPFPVHSNSAHSQNRFLLQLPFYYSASLLPALPVVPSERFLSLARIPALPCSTVTLPSTQWLGKFLTTFQLLGKEEFQGVQQTLHN